MTLLFIALLAVSESIAKVGGERDGLGGCACGGHPAKTRTITFQFHIIGNSAKVLQIYAEPTSASQNYLGNPQTLSGLPVYGGAVGRLPDSVSRFYCIRL